MAIDPASTKTRPLEDPLGYLPCSHIWEYQQHQVIYSPDGLLMNLFLIIGGKVMVRRITTDGREVVVDIYVVDEFFGDGALIDAINNNERAIAIEQNTRVMSWTSTDVHELILRRPQLGIAFIQLLARRCTDYRGRIESFSSDYIARRLVRALMHFADRLGDKLDDGSIQLIPLSHELLAQYIGTSRHGNRFVAASANVTAGLMWQPETLPTV